MSKKILGIDIGTRTMKIAVVDGKKVEKLVFAEMPEDMSRAGMISTYDAMADFLKEILAENKLKVKKCSVILPSGHAYIRKLSMPYMTPKMLMTNLPYEFKDFLNQPSDKYYFDYSLNEIIYDEEGKPTALDVLAACVPRSVIADYRAMFKRAGLELVVGVPAEMAYANLINQLGGNEEENYAILDLAHMGCRLHVYSGTGYYASRVMDTGMLELDNRIAAEQFVDIHIAHAYKESNHKDVLNQPSAKELYDTIATDVRKAVNFHNFSNREKTIQDLYLTGGAVVIDGLVEAIRTQLPDLELHSIQELCPDTNATLAEISSAAAAIGAAL